jgi:hypothetical protein
MFEKKQIQKNRSAKPENGRKNEQNRRKKNEKTTKQSLYPR